MLDWRLQLTLCVVIALIGTVLCIDPAKHNNYLIFKGVFFHLKDGLNLFSAYPDEYYDTNHYGPLFAVVIAPFAILPDIIGLLFWNLALSVGYFAAVTTSSLSNNTKCLIFYTCAFEFLLALTMQQFNVAIVSLLLGAYTLVEKRKDFWASILILLGTFVKIYCIVGMVFFLFSKNKRNFALGLIIGSIVFFALPMVFSSPEYVIGQYREWYLSIVDKNAQNLMTLWQNISVFGLIRRIGYASTYGFSELYFSLHQGAPIHNGLWTDFSDLWVLIPAFVLFAASVVRRNKWDNMSFRTNILASVLLCICLFSTGTEFSGYIIAMTGAAIWFGTCSWKRNWFDTLLFIMAMLISIDYIFPNVLRDKIICFALIAVPFLLIWTKLTVELLRK